MNIAIVVNPRSGRGKSVNGARLIESILRERGHRYQTLETGSDQQELCDVITDSDRVLVLGGDGTVHHLLPALEQTQTPMYHFGTGTANLISKEFGMSKTPQIVVEHLERDVEPLFVDLPTCNGTPFLIMVSIGIDASVIHRFQEARSHKGGYRAYIQPILRELFSPRPASFSVETNANPPYSQAGILIVSNLRSYGGGLNPCPHANPCDGQLDAVVLPCRSSLNAGVQYGYLKIRRSMPNTKRMIGERFRIQCSGSSAYVQVDGEKADRIDGLVDGRVERDQYLDIALDGSQILIHSPESHHSRNVR
ncbi:hypothetical protein COB72_00865 [bacterium]|nr:MAG: hypothetical protein COB72_00865 [bacterium]